MKVGPHATRLQLYEPEVALMSKLVPEKYTRCVVEYGTLVSTLATESRDLFHIFLGRSNMTRFAKCI